MRQVRAVGTAPVGDPAVGDFGIGIIKIHTFFRELTRKNVVMGKKTRGHAFG